MAPLQISSLLFISVSHLLICTGDSKLLWQDRRIRDSVEGLSNDIKRSDDVSLTSLQTLLQQQAASFQALESRLNVVELELRTESSKNQHQAEEITSLKSRLAVLSKSVGFTAKSSSPEVVVGVHGILHFDSVVSGVGGGFDTQTGIFTAPVSGLYVFFLTIMTTVDHGGAVDIAIMKEGTALDVVWAEGAGDSYDQGSSLVTVHVRAGEKVWVQHANGDTALMGQSRTIFSGYLVQAD